MIIPNGEVEYREMTAEEKLKMFIDTVCKHEMNTDELITLLISELAYYIGKCEMYERQISIGS